MVVAVVEGVSVRLRQLGPFSARDRGPAMERQQDLVVGWWTAVELRQQVSSVTAPHWARSTLRQHHLLDVLQSSQHSASEEGTHTDAVGDIVVDVDVGMVGAHTVDLPNVLLSRERGYSQPPCPRSGATKTWSGSLHGELRTATASSSSLRELQQ